MNTGWLIGLTPIWSAIRAAWMLRERPGAAKVAGLSVGFLGAVLVVSRGRLEPGMLALPAARGDFLILASTVNWAFYTVLCRQVVKRIGPAQATAGALGASPPNVLLRAGDSLAASGMLEPWL